MKPRFKAKQGNDGLWYWRLKSPNGRTVADGSEGYSRKRDCLRAIGRVKVLMAAALVVMGCVSHRVAVTGPASFQCAQQGKLLGAVQLDEDNTVVGKLCVVLREERRD